MQRQQSVEDTTQYKRMVPRIPVNYPENLRVGRRVTMPDLAPPTSGCSVPKNRPQYVNDHEEQPKFPW
jgi:hypothetical protein